MSVEKTDMYRKTVSDVALWGPVGNKEGKPRQPSAKSTSECPDVALIVLPQHH